MYGCVDTKHLYDSHPHPHPHPNPHPHPYTHTLTHIFTSHADKMMFSNDIGIFFCFTSTWVTYNNNKL
jgi:hypothetical protein